MPTLLAAPDKFRGTASAAEVAGAMAPALPMPAGTATTLPISDGGEGLLDASAARTAPRGHRPARRADRGRLAAGRHGAVIEMAAASGLALVAGRNDPLTATTRGTGELIAAALDAGAVEVLVGVGGSATTDGGHGAVEVLAARAPLPRLTVAADVTTRFVDAARCSRRRKAPTRQAIAALTAAWTAWRHVPQQVRRGRPRAARFGRRRRAGRRSSGAGRPDPSRLRGRRRPADLRAQIAAADLVLTGEGRLDETSLLGKAPVQVVRLCRTPDRPVALVVGGSAVV